MTKSALSPDGYDEDIDLGPLAQGKCYGFDQN